MRRTFVLVGIFLSAFATAAQDNSSATFQLEPVQTAAPAPCGTVPFVIPSPTVPVCSLGAPPVLESSLGLVPGTASPSPEPPLIHQGPIAVYERYSWQLAADYIFFRFYELPEIQQNYNGLIATANYYFMDWFAAEGEFMGSWRNQSGVSSHLTFGGGGPRFRWSAPRNVEIFGHGLVGRTHFVPQTSFGPTDAFAYIVGGGADINPRHRRFAYRIGADMMGTHFFGTYQFSPRAYVGFVFKF